MIAFESGEDVGSPASKFLLRFVCSPDFTKYAQLYKRVVHILNNVNNVNQSVSPLSMTIQYRAMKMTRTTATIAIEIMMNNFFSL